MTSLTNTCLPDFGKDASQSLYTFTYSTCMGHKSIHSVCSLIRIQVEGRMIDICIESRTS